jgi:hypothetical protein
LIIDSAIESAATFNTNKPDHLACNPAVGNVRNNGPEMLNGA